MKKIFVIFILVFVATSCNKVFDEAMKSTDKNFILETANQYFAEKKWRQAISLYERLPNLVYGTDDARTVVFNTAYANYYDKQYRIAGHHFKNFSVTFPDDPRAEEAAYMSALCYYEGSLDYNLDQTNTESAINELQNFINKHPNSERATNINALIDELSYKLEFKAYENARQYFKMAEYLAADVAFENVLEDYPSTKLRNKIYEFRLKSKYELAINSVYSKKEDRIESALAYTKFIELEQPEAALVKSAIEIKNKLEIEKEKFAKTKQQVEEDRAKMEIKQKKALAELQEQEKKQEEKKLSKKTKKQEEKKVDSTEISTIENTTTFKIPRN